MKAFATLFVLGTLACSGPALAATKRMAHKKHKKSPTVAQLYKSGPFKGLASIASVPSTVK